MDCPSCGYSNRSGIRFCEECGGSLPLAPATSGGTSCPGCGHPNRSGIRFCEECGVGLGAAAPAGSATAGTTCSSCGFANRAGLRFCEECGAPVGAAAAAATPAPVAAVPSPAPSPSKAAPSRRRSPGLKWAAAVAAVALSGGIGYVVVANSGDDGPGYASGTTQASPGGTSAPATTSEGTGTTSVASQTTDSPGTTTDDGSAEVAATSTTEAGDETDTTVTETTAATATTTAATAGTAIPQDDWNDTSGCPAGAYCLTTLSPGWQTSVVRICPRTDWPASMWADRPALTLTQLVDRAIAMWNRGAEQRNANIELLRSCDGLAPQVDVEFAVCESLSCNREGFALKPGMCTLPAGVVLGDQPLPTECAGHAQSPRTGTMNEALDPIRLIADPGRYSAARDPGARNMTAILAHEIGHSLGIGHSSDQNALMWPTNQGLQQLGEDDKNALSRLYPDPGEPTLIEVTSVSTERFNQNAGTQQSHAVTWPYPNNGHPPFVICGIDTYNPPWDERDMGWRCDFEFDPADEEVSIRNYTTGTPSFVTNLGGYEHYGGTAAIVDSTLVRADFFPFVIHNGSPIDGRASIEFYAPSPPEGVFFTQVYHYDPAGSKDFGYTSIYTPLGNDRWRVDITPSGGNYSSWLAGQVVVLRRPAGANVFDFRAESTWGRVYATELDGQTQWEGVDWTFDGVADAEDLQLPLIGGYDETLSFVVLESYHRDSSDDYLSVAATPDPETGACVPWNSSPGAATPPQCVRAHVDSFNGERFVDFADLKLIVVHLGEP